MPVPERRAHMVGTPNIGQKLTSCQVMSPVFTGIKALSCPSAEVGFSKNNRDMVRLNGQLFPAKLSNSLNAESF
jgi:hypothetical protein